jgi:hypothetical protein
LKSWAIYQHVEHNVSLSKLISLCDEFFHMRIHLNFVCMAKAIMADRYRPTFKLLMRRLLAGSVIYVDETEISLRHGKGYVWVLANNESVVFLYRPNREATFLKELLAGFQGVVVSDFYSGYDGLLCLQQKCLIHLIRDMNTDLRSHSFDNELKTLTGEFATLLRGIVDTIDRHGLNSKWLTKHKPHAVAFLDRICRAEYRSQVAQGYKERLAKYRDRLFAFLERDGVSWNNNDAEHAIKYFAHYRMLVDGTVVASRLMDHLTLLSVCVTCKYKQVSFLRFMLSQEHDIDVFAQQRKGKRRKRRIEVYPKGFPPRRGTRGLSNKEVQDIADKSEVGDLFRDLLAGLRGYFSQTHVSLSGVSFNGRAKREEPSFQIMTLRPRDSSVANGLRYTIYADRFSDFFGVKRDTIRKSLPSDLKADQGGSRFIGRWMGHFREPGEVDKFLGMIRSGSARIPRTYKPRFSFRRRRSK